MRHKQIFPTSAICAIASAIIAGCAAPKATDYNTALVANTAKGPVPSKEDLEGVWQRTKTTGAPKDYLTFAHNHQQTDYAGKALAEIRTIVDTRGKPLPDEDAEAMKSLVAYLVKEFQHIEGSTMMTSTLKVRYEAMDIWFYRDLGMMGYFGEVRLNANHYSKVCVIDGKCVTVREE